MDELARSVDSRDSFLAFVEALAADRKRDGKSEVRRPSSPFGATKGGWENTSVEAFLEAAVACARDGHLLSPQPTWREMAIFLLGGKAYE